ncbi:MAG: hypothetical protein EBT86_02360 [Actinobacteria bacterium]|nr:hypothetical protein [Actinomycetota bacterium]
MLSYAWRGSKGSGKRTALLRFLQESYKKGEEIENEKLEINNGIWIMNKNGDSVTRNGSEDAGSGSGSGGVGGGGGGGVGSEEELEGKKIPYEYSKIHLGFDVARMSMSDKIFLSSILQRWTGQKDLTLTNTNLQARYLVLYHAHLLTDESILLIQETLEKYDNFSILLTTELPVCNRLEDYCFEIPVAGADKLFQKYKETWEPNAKEDCWLTYFRQTFEKWTTMNSFQVIGEVREWIYVCLQRNLRWTDVLQYWMEVVDEITWLSKEDKKVLWKFLANVESGGGWYLIPSYRIPVFWEKVHSNFAELGRKIRQSKKIDVTGKTSENSLKWTL